MNEKGQASERERRDWVIILIILLFGFLCVIIAGERASRFALNWKLDTNMRSNLDPDSDFLTNKPVVFYEPLDPSILTQPAWLNVFQTPGALFETRTPVLPSNITGTPSATNTLLPTRINSPTAIGPVTNTPTATLPTPTNTPKYFPPPSTNTPRPPATRTLEPPTTTNTPLSSPTSTSIATLTATHTPTATGIPPTLIPVDLSITKTSSPTTYIAGSTVAYTIVVNNNGTNNVTGATISDPKPPQVTSWGWCVAPCTPDANSSTTDLSDTINLAAGNSITYTVLAKTDPSATVDLVNTASVFVPASYTDTAPANNSAMETDTFTASTDLQIAKTDNSTEYIGGAIKTYYIDVYNAGPSDVTGATVNDLTLTNATNPNIASATWTCSSADGGTCTPSGSGNINDTVNLPAGSTVTYEVSVTVVGMPLSGSDLVNTATVTASSDPDGTNNSATDTDTLIEAEPLPPDAGTKDNIFFQLLSGNTLTLNINLTADGDAGPDLVYYEYLTPPAYTGILLDWVVIEISDGSNWYTVFYWGDNNRDQNTNVDYMFLTLPVTPPDPEEVDQREILAGDLYGGTGVAIDIDSIVPSGTYTFIRFYAPLGDVDGGTEIDAIEILP